MLISSYLISLENDGDLLAFDFKTKSSILNIRLKKGIYLVIEAKEVECKGNVNDFAWILYEKRVLLVRKRFADVKRIL